MSKKSALKALNSDSENLPSKLRSNFAFFYLFSVCASTTLNPLLLFSSIGQWVIDSSSNNNSPQSIN